MECAAIVGFLVTLVWWLVKVGRRVRSHLVAMLVKVWRRVGSDLVALLVKVGRRVRMWLMLSGRRMGIVLRSIFCVVSTALVWSALL